MSWFLPFALSRFWFGSVPAPCLCCFLFVAAPGFLGLARHLLGVLDDFLDAAGHVEGLLRQVVVLAVDNLLEPADGVLERDINARTPGECLSHVERLRQETLQFARPGDGELV